MKTLSLTQQECKLLQDALNVLLYKPFLISLGNFSGYRYPTVKETEDREKMIFALLEKLND